MPRLESLLNDPNQRAALTRDCVEVVQQRVKQASGMSGRVLRTGYKMAEGGAPGLIRRAVVHLLPDFLMAMEPLYRRSRESEQSLGEYLCGHSTETADALLAVTDHRIGAVKSRTVRTAYARMRKTAHGHIEAALPDLAARLERYVLPR